MSSTTTNPLPPSRWWTQLHSLFLRRKELTKEEKEAICNKPLSCTLIPLIVVSNILLLFVILPTCHVNFSVESISVSPSSSATLHVDFLVKNPSLLCPIYYNRDDVYAKLGSSNAAVLKTTHTRGRHASFSVDLATESHQSDVVAAYPRVFELDMKLSARKKIPVYGDYYGHFDIRCQNLTLGYQKIKCHSSFNILEDCCNDLF